uniref:Uncharacterized protein n=1 Tax=Strigamia maritima TaxID=126957 RepID=T1IXU4_STRMM
MASTVSSLNNGHTEVNRSILITKIDHKSIMTDGNPIVDLDESSMSALVSSTTSEVDLLEACQDCYVRLIKVELPTDLLKSCKDCYVRLSKLQSSDLLSTCRQCYVVVPKLNESKLVQ